MSTVEGTKQDAGVRRPAVRERRRGRPAAGPLVRSPAVLPRIRGPALAPDGCTQYDVRVWPQTFTPRPVRTGASSLSKWNDRNRPARCRIHRTRIAWTAPLVLAGFCALAGGRCLAGTHIWRTDPVDYQIIDPVAVADGRITYQIDLGGFNIFGGKGLSAAQLAHLADGVRRAFITWNQVIAPIGLEFAEAQPGQVFELAVRAVPYDRLRPVGTEEDSIALALDLPLRHIHTVLPIWFDATEDLGNLLDAPVVADRLLSQPHVRLVDSRQYDIYSVGLHEMGHVLGLGHVADGVRAAANYNFLGMSTVLLDAACLRPSVWVGGLDTHARRPILETELPSIMIPIRRGTVTTVIPPDDRATVAFLLRHLNPAGAEQMLAEARTLYGQTTPLRFANVRYEAEKNGGFERNATLESAMPVGPNEVIIGSLFGKDEDDGPYDADCYRLDLSTWPAGTPVVLDVVEAGGLPDTGATGVRLQLLDEQGSTVALGHPVGALGAGHYSTEDPILIWSLAVPGVYYILVEQPGDATPGTYVLKIGVGGPTEPTGQVQPTLDASGSEGCPTITPSAGLCPVLGFTVLTLPALALFVVRPRRQKPTLRET